MLSFFKELNNTNLINEISVGALLKALEKYDISLIVFDYCGNKVASSVGLPRDNKKFNSVKNKKINRLLVRDELMFIYLFE